LSFLTGLEFRDSNFVITAKCQAIVQAGMVFAVHTGLQDVQNRSATSEPGRSIALLISDTVLVVEVR
jgi:nucleosome binding factor SPN SPT16 subunit